jgi:hypothetical protein
VDRLSEVFFSLFKECRYSREVRPESKSSGGLTTAFSGGLLFIAVVPHDNIVTIARVHREITISFALLLHGSFEELTSLNEDLPRLDSLVSSGILVHGETLDFLHVLFLYKDAPEVAVFTILNKIADSDLSAHVGL